MKPQPSGSKINLIQNLFTSPHTLRSPRETDLVSVVRGSHLKSSFSGTRGRVGGLRQLERESPEDPVRKHPGETGKVPEKAKVGAQSRVVQIVHEF